MKTKLDIRAKLAEVDLKIKELQKERREYLSHLSELDSIEKLKLAQIGEHQDEREVTMHYQIVDDIFGAVMAKVSEAEDVFYNSEAQFIHTWDIDIVCPFCEEKHYLLTDGKRVWCSYCKLGDTFSGNPKIKYDPNLEVQRQILKKFRKISHV